MFACCNACCPSPRKRGHKLPQDDGYRPPYSSSNPNAAPYQSHPPPVYHSHQVPAAPAAPQFATFDVSSSNKSSNPDALPSMPSWDTAAQKKVEYYEDPSDTVEMNDLGHNAQHPPGTADSQQAMLTGGAAGAAAAGGLRPGMYARGGSHSPGMSPVDERSSYNSQYSSGHPGGQHYPTASDVSGYGAGGGAATGGYRGAAPAPPHQQSYSPYGDRTPSHTSPTRQDFPQYGGHQQQSPPQQQYTPYGAGYSQNSGPRSPPMRSNYSGSTAAEPSSEYPDAYRPAQQMHDPDSYVQRQPTWNGGGGGGGDQMGRKPVNGSWRDI
jgi:hypothetical protein